MTISSANGQKNWCGIIISDIVTGELPNDLLLHFHIKQPITEASSVRNYTINVCKKTALLKGFLKKYSTNKDFQLDPIDIEISNQLNKHSPADQRVRLIKIGDDQVVRFPVGGQKIREHLDTKYRREQQELDTKSIADYQEYRKTEIAQYQLRKRIAGADKPDLSHVVWQETDLFLYHYLENNCYENLDIELVKEYTTKLGFPIYASTAS